MDKTTKTVSSSSHSKDGGNRRLTPEDFIILIIHNDANARHELSNIMEDGHFTVHQDEGAGAIGSLLMFTPHVAIFDWDDDPEACLAALDFIRNQDVASHISKLSFIILASEKAPEREGLESLKSDKSISIVDYQSNMSYRSTLKKHILRLFLKEQREIKKGKKLSDAEAASQHLRTASMNELLTQNKTFNEAVIRMTQTLIHQTADGDPQKTFDMISKALEVLHRPFVLTYESENNNFEVLFEEDKGIQKLRDLKDLAKRKKAEKDLPENHISEQDRRCFFGNHQQLFFATESPDIFKELDNFANVTKNFELLLIQAEKRKLQIELLEDFKLLFDDVYAQTENLEWSEALETMHEIVNNMFNLDHKPGISLQRKP